MKELYNQQLSHAFIIDQTDVECKKWGVIYYGLFVNPNVSAMSV